MFPKAQAKQLANGELAIVKSDVKRDPYVLVPAAAATEIAGLIANRVLLSHDGSEDELSESLSETAQKKLSESNKESHSSS